MKKTIILLFYLINIYLAFGQQPFRINPADGLPFLDALNNPIRNDKNYAPIPKFQDEFASERITKDTFSYGTNLNYADLNFFLQEDSIEDNLNNNGYFGSIVPYPVAHFYQNNGNISSIKLVTKQYQAPYAPGWYKNANTGWARTKKAFECTSGQLISKNAYQYGYYEARFKVNRPAGASNTGIGQCFWLFDFTNETHKNIPQYVAKHCYSEIDIAENNPQLGTQTFGAFVSKNDPINNENCNRNDLYNAHECWCPYCDPIDKCLFDYFVEQDSFHTYALEWTPSSLKYFYDNVLIHTINNIGAGKKKPADLDPMNIIFDIESANDVWTFHERCQHVNSNTLFPFEFEIDYVKQYKLDLSKCQVILPTIYNQNSFNNFTISPKVYKQIILNGPILVNNGMDVSIRAADFIELNDGFEVATDGVFFADVIGGCDEGY